MSPRPLVGPRLRTRAHARSPTCRAPRCAHHRARRAFRGLAGGARAHLRTAAALRVAPVHRRPPHGRVDGRRHGRDPTRRVLRAAAAPHARGGSWRCSPPGARCCRSPARTRRTARRPARQARRRVLNAGGRHAVHVGGSDHLEELQDAASASEQVEIDYYSFSRDEMTTCIVDPWRVFHAFGAWYLAAWCDRANGERLFRVDQCGAVRPTGEHFEEPELASSESGERGSGRRRARVPAASRRSPGLAPVGALGRLGGGELPARSRRAGGRRLVAGRARHQRAGVAGTPPPRARAGRHRRRATRRLPGGVRRRHRASCAATDDPPGSRVRLRCIGAR